MYAPGVVARFWSKVDVRKETACWLWRGEARHLFGYGAFHPAHGQTEGAHRVAFEIMNGPIPDGMAVCHHCDNPPCCNPAHLFLGTPGDNVRDAQTKGRSATGERNGASKLAVEDVVAIRAVYGHFAQADIARRYGVSAQTIANIAKRKKWAHIP